MWEEIGTMSKRPELLKASDAEIEDAVKYADPMVLRGVLYQLTGDESVTRVRIGPMEFGNVEAAAVADPADVALLQGKTADFLKAYRDRGAPDLHLERDRLHKALNLTAGDDIPDAEYEMWFEQSALDPFARTFTWREPPAPQTLQGFTVAVIGAGLAGLAAAVSLKRAGIPYTLIEKNPDVGGTWLENRYPGARVDSASRVYSHIFGADYPFPYSYCPRDENLKYINWITDRFELREHAVFNTEITAMVWDEAANEWVLTATGPDGQRTMRANAVITAVGFLSRPNLPSIEGMDAFQGVSMHTARWPEGLDHVGKRIAVIGTGASGYQLTPELAKTAGHLYLFQRSPSWCFDLPVYLDPSPPQPGWLDRNLPLFRNFTRFRMSWFSAPDHLAKNMHIDPQFEDPHARSARNKKVRDARIAFIESKLKDRRPDLVEKMIPKSPPMATRPVMVDRKYCVYDTLLQDNVSLVSDPIARVTPRGIQLENGEEIAVDIIVYATGFKANEFLWPMEVRGRDGRTIEELWAKDGARAYLTAMMPGFPNFFVAYGPNSNNWSGLQVIDFEELTIRFAVGCIAGLIAENKRAVDVAEDAYWRYAAEVDACEARMVYSDPRVTTYYKNHFGRSAANNPIDIRRIWAWTRNPAPSAATGPSPLNLEAEAAIRPRFGADLVVE
jgi:4-hydroxyacetophenone monooxygenase